MRQFPIVMSQHPGAEVIIQYEPDKSPQVMTVMMGATSPALLTEPLLR
jgi:hypothetical protein